MWNGILTGLATAFSPINILAVFCGCFVGTFIGLLPGLGPISAIVLMIPITYSLEPSTAMILIAGVYYGAIFGGSTSSILINAPGVAGTVASSFDGYPLAKSGKAGKALALAAYSSCFGGTIAAIFLLFLAPNLAQLSLSFQSADYFLVMVLGLTSVSAFSGGNYIKSLLMTIFGLMLATVGTDSSGVQRFTFGNPDFIDGISFLLLAMSIFALAEAFTNILNPQDNSPTSETIRDFKVTREEAKQVLPTATRSSILGFFVGVLPGAGATIASFLAYGIAKKFAKKEEQEKFGKGSLEGLVAPETANNAACSGSFVPLLTLGIPGSGTTAIILGALISYGIQPGPRLFQENPEVFWSVIVSMYIGNVVLLILNLPLIPFISKILTIKRTILLPFIIFFSFAGVYLVSFNTTDLYVMVLFSLVALIFKHLKFPLAPILLGFVLGKPLEENFRRAMIASDGSFSFLWERTTTLVIFICLVVIVTYPAIQKFFVAQKAKSKNI